MDSENEIQASPVDCGLGACAQCGDYLTPHTGSVRSRDNPTICGKCFKLNKPRGGSEFDRHRERQAAIKSHTKAYHASRTSRKRV